MRALAAVIIAVILAACSASEATQLERTGYCQYSDTVGFVDGAPVILNGFYSGAICDELMVEFPDNTRWIPAPKSAGVALTKLIPA